MADGRNGKMKILSTPADHRWLVGIVVWEIQKQTSLLYHVHFNCVLSEWDVECDLSVEIQSKLFDNKEDVTEIQVQMNERGQYSTLD